MSIVFVDQTRRCCAIGTSPSDRPLLLHRCLSAQTGMHLGSPLLGSPMILLGALLAAFTLKRVVDSLSRLSRRRPICPECSLSLRFWNLTVIVTGLLLAGVLLGYAFVENFQARPGS